VSPIGPRLRHFLGAPQPEGFVASNGGRLLAHVRQLEVRARQAMTAGLAGQYNSAFKGRGLEFEEVREYRRGDDVRTIDWNVTARTGRLHVKLFREERDLTVLLLADLSASTRFGSGPMTVHDLIAEVSGLFALAAGRRDRVGAVLFDDHVRAIIPPRRGWRHGLRVAGQLLGAEPAGRGTAAGEAMGAAARLLHRRGIVIPVVDRACVLPSRELRGLGARHDVVVIRVGDPLLERSASEVPLPVSWAEGPGRAVFAGGRLKPPPPVPAGVDVLELSTGEDYLPAVRALFRERERRRAR